MNVARWVLLGLFGVIALIGAAVPTPGQYAVIRTANSGAAFHDPADPPQPSQTQKDLEEIKKKLDEIDKKLDKIMEDGADPPPPNPSANTTEDNNALGKGLTTCIACHSQATAPKNGDRFVMFQKPEGANYPLRDDFRRSELKSIEDKVRDGTMPKKTATGKKLTPEQSTAIIAEAAARRRALETADK